MAIELTSEAFRDGDRIPRRFTGDGDDISPPLSWSDPPAGACSFALICEDPDAPRATFTHWVIFNIPPDCRALVEGVPNECTLPNGASQGRNDFGRIGYGGPAPPPGKPHRYFFKLFALDSELNLPAGASAKQCLTAARRHLVAEGQLIGKYERSAGNRPMLKPRVQ